MNLINCSLLGSAITAFFLFYSRSISLCLFVGRRRVPPWVSCTEFDSRVRTFNQLPSKYAVLQIRPALTRPQFLDESMLPTLQGSTNDATLRLRLVG
ncbi:hypothetical protein DFH08DRAFT_896748 [Mycena albidolilacea]|uniref:Uncharacterized protein n=1 Tax=Mycena albidolilacea TaxID=1033008 RepID=A0AAD6Z9L6_9AGAR|nr:hypothetical protein DFH08DRAFT_896748 [Mycena albidolilacea]